ncbi:uncharacterized protein V1510DRAFT_208973 [Dipodascopsis tothii]|uniref:uncharacterized protein n=1 Tax=Dipodascopsis tothii TaxID=44089 RepID=UPI0034CE8C4D
MLHKHWFQVEVQLNGPGVKVPYGHLPPQSGPEESSFATEKCTKLSGNVIIKAPCAVVGDDSRTLFDSIKCIEVAFLCHNFVTGSSFDNFFHVVLFKQNLLLYTDHQYKEQHSQTVTTSNRDSIHAALPVPLNAKTMQIPFQFKLPNWLPPSIATSTLKITHTVSGSIKYKIPSRSPIARIILGKTLCTAESEKTIVPVMTISHPDLSLSDGVESTYATGYSSRSSRSRLYTSMGGGRARPEFAWSVTVPDFAASETHIPVSLKFTVLRPGVKKSLFVDSISFGLVQERQLNRLAFIASSSHSLCSYGGKGVVRASPKLKTTSFIADTCSQEASSLLERKGASKSDVKQDLWQYVLGKATNVGGELVPAQKKSSQTKKDYPVSSLKIDFLPPPPEHELGTKGNEKFPYDHALSDDWDYDSDDEPQCRLLDLAIEDENSTEITYAVKVCLSLRSAKNLLPTSDSPILNVKHKVRVKIRLASHSSGTKKLVEKYVIMAPIILTNGDVESHISLQNETIATSFSRETNMANRFSSDSAHSHGSSLPSLSVSTSSTDSNLRPSRASRGELITYEELVDSENSGLERETSEQLPTYDDAVFENQIVHVHGPISRTINKSQANTTSVFHEDYTFM